MNGFVVERLSATYYIADRVLPAVRDASLAVAPGETVGLVGESGSGKTTLAMAAISSLPPNGVLAGGSAWLGNVNLLTLPRRGLRAVWGSRIGLVSQNPQGSFNPSATIGRQLDEMGRRHLGLGRRAARDMTLSMLHRVKMPESRSVAARYPHQLSGGMLQRGAIAMALMTNPALLILDEPTTALDVTTQAAILDLLKELKDEYGSALLYITHNLGVVSQICDRIAVMYAGELVEEGASAHLFGLALHPYTVNLINCEPRFEQASRSSRLANIPGSLPALDDLPPGCIFTPRCPLAVDICRESRPPLIDVGEGRKSACWRWEFLRSEDGQQAAIQYPAGSRRTAASAPPTRPAWDGPFLEAKHVVKIFPSEDRKRPTVAIDDATISIHRTLTLGLVGESGCGKTTLARVIAGLTPPTRGTVSLEGEVLAANATARDRDVLKRLQMVFQNPDASLNPRRTTSEALIRPLMLLGGLDRETATERAGRLLAAVNLPRPYLDRYPAELSGGEKQRVAIARAFAADPDLVICDEPISSLDASVQGSLMNLLLDLQEERGTAYLFISHDLAAVRHLSHRIAVMYLGRLVEVGDVEQVLSAPHHPYTEALLSAVPAIAAGSDRTRPRDPEQIEPPSGCLFHPRCPRSLGDVCREQQPAWQVAEPGETAHTICCHIPLDELARLQAEGPRAESSPDPSGSAPGEDVS